MNWKGVPTYEDLLSNVYIRRDDCTVRTYTTLDQYIISIGLTISKRLTCEEIEKNKFQCDSVVESTWFRVWDAGSGSGILDSCGNQWYEQYQDVMSIVIRSFLSLGRFHVSLMATIL